MHVVISQSMLFPWVGLLEQVRLADVFVHYDDVQFSKGSFVNRVQVKTPQGRRWMTVPLKQVHLGQRIDEIEVMPTSQWKARHLDLLRLSFRDAPYADDALQIAESIYCADYPHVGALARASLLALCHYFGLFDTTRFVDIKDLDVHGSSSERVLSVVRSLGGHDYITGHGAARYLDHKRFEQAGVGVSYMNYRQLPYPQSHGEFTPFVSGLDLVAHCGRDGVRYVCSDTVNWKEFVHESE